MGERVLEAITFTSPSGVEYTAAWSGSQHTVDKKVGQFEYPDVDGGGSQDLGLSIQKYPLNFIFSGQGYVSNARSFEVSLSERGPWSVKHPFLGLMDLQPVTFKFNDDPIKSKNAITVSSTWIRVLPMFKGTNFRDSEANVLEAAITLEPEMSVALPEVPWSDEEGKQYWITAILNVLAAIKKAFDKFFEMSNKIRQSISEAIAAVEHMIDQVFLVASAVISAIVTIIQLPATAETLVTSKMRMFKALGLDIRERLRIDLDDNASNVSVATASDQIQAGLMGAMAISTTNGKVLSRSDAVEVAESLYDEYYASIEMSEAFEAGLSKKLSKDSYLGNIAGYASYLNLVGLTIGYVNNENYSQQIKKIITTKKFEATLNFAIAQYSDMQPEQAYQYLIDTNALAGDDIVFLPPNRNVVVYV